MTLVLAEVVLPAWGTQPPRRDLPGSARASPDVAADYGRLPIAFEAYEGRAGDGVRFFARGLGYGLYLHGTEVVLNVRSGPAAASADSVRIPLGAARDAGSPRHALVRMRLVGADGEARVSGHDRLPGTSNYFVGNDPARWRRDVPTYARVRSAGVYPGIDLVFYGNQRQLEYDFEVAPGADPARIAIAFEGIERLALDREGDLRLDTAAGPLVMHKPVAYQDIAGERRPVECGYALHGLSLVGFRLGRFDRSAPLVIDPVLRYSTSLGGSGGDNGTGIAVDADGGAYVAGSTSGGLPTTSGAFQPAFGGPPFTSDAFVAKLSPDGTAVLYSTFLGGSGDDGGLGIAVDEEGNAYVAGFSQSPDFPTTAGAFQESLGMAFQGAFVAKLDAAGRSLVYSTLLRGNGFAIAQGIALDRAGSAYVTGFAADPLFPTTPGAYQSAYGGVQGPFVAKLGATGTGLAYSTFLGGTGGGVGVGIAVHPQGDAFVTGYTYSAEYPTTAGAHQTAFGSPSGGTDAFVVRLDASGSALVYSTLLGGNAGDVGIGIAVDGGGSAYVAGYTTSSDFPTTAGAFREVLSAGSGASDGFATKLDPMGTGLAYSTYLGGSDADFATSIAVDAGGNAHIAGFTRSSDFPVTTSALQASLAGRDDAFLTRLDSSGGRLAFSTYLGGRLYDRAFGVAVDGKGSAYVTGYSESSGFPATPGRPGGFEDSVTRSFVAKFSGLDSILPSAPRMLGATAAESGVAVAFDPGDLGSGALVTHNVRCSSRNGGAAGSGRGMASPVAVDGLTRGAAYTCAASTTSTVGTGPWSADSNEVVVGPPGPGVATRFTNFSSRGPVRSGDQVMIGGFTIGGALPKRVLLTARGPSMAALGVSGTLADPVLTLYSGTTPIASNDDFGSAPNASEIPASLRPVDARESAILATLKPGAYTATVTGSGGTTGIAIVEVFEVDAPEIPLVNIATRAPVSTGDQVLIGGFIIQGDAPGKVLVTARGPSLAAQGVQGVLANPTLTLYSGQAVIATNDDWGANANAAAIQATGVAPADGKEAALLLTLDPGAYTAIVTGVDGGTGIGIVEVFAQ